MLRIQCNRFLHNYCPWRSPFPNPCPPQETLDIVARYPCSRDATIDEVIARASQINNHLSFEVIDVKCAGPDYFSQVLFGKLEGMDTAICVKLFDECLFPSRQQPEYGEGIESELQLLNLNFADDMMHCEEGVYCDRLQYLQGSMIPHCYGFHMVCLPCCPLFLHRSDQQVSKFTLPDGWEVLGFFMEIIDGPSLWEVGQQNKSLDFHAGVVRGIQYYLASLHHSCSRSMTVVQLKPNSGHRCAPYGTSTWICRSRSERLASRPDSVSWKLPDDCSSP